MEASESEERYYLPDGGQDLTELRSVLAATDESAASHLVLTREEGEGKAALPDALRRLLLQAVDVLDDGLAVAVVPRATMLTTQQAADILEVSRSTVTRLVADGELPTERPGARRGIRLADALACRDRRRRRQHAMLAETFSGLSETADDEASPIRIPHEGDAPRNGLPSRDT